MYYCLPSFLSISIPRIIYPAMLNYSSPHWNECRTACRSTRGYVAGYKKPKRFLKITLLEMSWQLHVGF